MRLSRLQIKNFRNFKSLDVELGLHLVIVGENRVGKSNLIHALRLILDPSLPDSQRQLRIEDFWDGSKPLTEDSKITVLVELSDFEDSAKHIALLSDYLVQSKPMVARLTYTMFPKKGLSGPPQKDSDFDFAVYGGSRSEKLITNEVRKRLPIDVLHALRDADADLSNWRRSPLRPLLDELVGSMNQQTMDELSQAANSISDTITNLHDVEQLNRRIVSMLKLLAGEQHSPDTILSFIPTEADRLVRALQVFIDGGMRSISESSLGSSNLIYLALKLLALEQEIKEKVRDHGFLAIEEPEAHLHPHVQRRVFRSFLAPRQHQGSNANVVANRTIILTTHSPHIASVTPLDSLVLLRSHSTPVETVAHTTKNAGMTQKDVNDVERYLDVTRGEILFSKGVILVEGEAEQYIVPCLARLIGYDLDELGISVCSVAGTNFAPYVKLLSKKSLSIPFSIITDEDPVEGKKPLAWKRVFDVLKIIGKHQDPAINETNLFRVADKNGVFVTPTTLEIALFRCGRHVSMMRALRELTTNNKAKDRATKWQNSPSSVDEVQLIKDIEEIGKGRYAQRLVTLMVNNRIPQSIKKAIAFVANRSSNHGK
jgi:putative ATP-dependent endonuclease of OLD family